MPVYSGQIIHGSSNGDRETPININFQGISQLAYQVSQKIPVPPFTDKEPARESMSLEKPKRNRRRSKFTKEQDEMIIAMKREGKSWVEIAESARVGSYLAARNRYQVLIGQQGRGNSESGPQDVLELRNLVDEAELEKWKYLSKELSKDTGRNYTPEQIREVVRYLFWKNPQEFDVDEKYLVQLIKQQSKEVAEIPTGSTGSMGSTGSAGSTVSRIPTMPAVPSIPAMQPMTQSQISTQQVQPSQQQPYYPFPRFQPQYIQPQGLGVQLPGKRPGPASTEKASSEENLRSPRHHKQ
ncbi:hypothetical protein FOA43_003102 [Brettanomyces nanus]|uniref:Adherence factor n=1 Tax=Eeniella nana TaxID=13502 RepID=A0A875S6Y5_EENNA|nr:uncharacterized protein FOA43_003102 [Brettanomyces nanus]QPG75742.1 hypothetical protein FOA43_003102 [Brettanomyces nanus]